MPKTDRIGALEIILRAQQHEIDLLSAKLGAIRARQAELECEIAVLIEKRDHEGLISSVESTAFVASFLNAIASQIRMRNEQITELEKEALVREGTLREKFAEMMTWRVSLDRLQTAHQAELDKSELATLDEVGRNIYLQTKY